MAENIHFKFDPNQDHQRLAIESVIGLFEGFPKSVREFQMKDECVPNIGADEVLDDEILANNMRGVQERNSLPAAATLRMDEGFELDVDGRVNSWRYPSFTVEMETGTGKTYVYLRTLFELHRQFGFNKFIVVVPSIAIYEGFIKAVEITKEHFRSLYHNDYLRLIKYDGDSLGQLRDFSHSQFLTVMVMTMAAFNKKSNNIYKPTEKLMGEKLPFEYIQEVRPILILDESQNYESETSKEALRTLHPLLALKYSATAGIKDRSGVWQYDNLIYQLNPLQAFRGNLVKRIQVIGVTEAGNANDQKYFRIKKLIPGPRVEAEVLINDGGRRELGAKTLRQGDDLKRKTGNEDYEGYVVDNISIAEGFVEFTNGEKFAIRTDEQEASEKREVFRRQIDETVQKHMEVQEKLKDQGIKVLSLFFIDRVANYRNEDGLIRQLFEEIFNKYKAGYDFYSNKDAAAVHEGYFASKQTKEGFVEIDTEGGRNDEEREAEKRAFELIMQKKEQLLSFDENVCFIFAHSALKEGWDNPNVFQICTLAQRYSERRRRQEIGRGMRLSVDQSGDRCQDPKVNILTVVANESYEDFVKGLQEQYLETGNALPPPPSNAHRVPARRNDVIFNRQEFVQFWNKIIQRTDYAIRVDTAAVVNDVVAKFSSRMLAPPEIIVRRGMYGFAKYEIAVLEIKKDEAKIKVVRTSSSGDDKELVQVVKKNSDLAKDFADPSLKGFVVVEIEMQKVIFGNDQTLVIEESFCFESQRPMVVDQKNYSEQDRSFPVFDLISRAADETFLTRKTVIEIFRRISDERKKLIFQNPEGFSSAFVFSIKEVLADHVAKRVEYQLLDEIEKYDFATTFPPTEKHPQRELIEGSPASLYDFVQYESGVEQSFITNRLNSDKKVILYFKFPDSFKVKLPKIIGNYVPDWGIVRQAEDGSCSVELVRETKFTPHENLLQYTNEKRKIWCAQKHFEKIGVGYSKIAPPFTAWWEASSEKQLTYDQLMDLIEIVPEPGSEACFKTHLPVYSLEAACGKFGKGQAVQELGWAKIDLPGGLKDDMFLVRATGRSMEPRIPDQAYCIFRKDHGDRDGKILLIECQDSLDPDTGKYTIKKFSSTKVKDERIEEIILSPLNSKFKDIILRSKTEEEVFRVAGEFVDVTNLR